MQQRRPTRARTDDDDIEMLVYDGRWSEASVKPYKTARSNLRSRDFFCLCPSTTNEAPFEQAYDQAD
jgi:hypothetical protein